jgi:predicted enzyme related to lactoylglutathione lyase
MKTTLLGLRTAIYFVDDVAAAKKWYSEVLGITPYFDEPFYVGFNIGGYELGLHPTDKRNDSQPNSVSVYWGVEDAQAAYDMLIAAGATAFEVPNEVGGGIVVAMVKDPWGNALGVIYNPHFVV